MKPLCVAAALALCFAAGCSDETGGEQQPEPEPSFDYPLDDILRFQHLQAKSTHNSYHLEPEGNDLLDWSYSHAPLGQQLGQQGVRHVELDIRYSYALEAFEVYHLPVIDEQTTCRLFAECLTALKDWSDAHRAHHPIVVQIEPKDALPADPEAYFASLHAEILGVWPDSRIVTPALVRGGHDTVGAAVLADGWPTLGQLRGKVMFTFNDSGEIREAYTFDGTSLAGRLVFPESAPGDPYAAIAVLNDPYDSDAIAAALAAHMLVRTRADSGGVAAGAEPSERQQVALASGAQFVTTDYPAPVAEHAYWLDLPGGTPSRCNPVTAPPECTSLAVEDPSFVGP